MQRIKGCLTAKFPDAFAIVATGEQAERSFMEQLFAHLRGKGIMLPDGDLARSVSYRINGEMGMVTLLAPTNGGGVVIKLPMHAVADAGMQRECCLRASPPSFI
jgi:hypothetical protein